MSFWGKLRRVVGHVVTLGLPFIIKAIAKKNPKAAPHLAIALEIIDAVLAERPDLYNKPGLYQEVKRRVYTSDDFTEAEKRVILAAAWKRVG
jgi:hypothetical protein